MAPFLRAGVHVLRSLRTAPSPLLCSQRELGLFKPPESNYLGLRWYAESAALEEACSSTQTANDTAGESSAAKKGEDSSKPFNIMEKQAALQEMPNAVKQECAARESSSALHTDKLTSQILGKLRNRANSIGSKDNGIPSKGESTSSNANEALEERSVAADDKWQQVVNSMRSMAAKKKGDLASSGVKSTLSKGKDGEKQDDFADLDLPQDNLSAQPVSNFAWNTKPKDGGFQNGKQKDSGFEGYQQKGKEAKPVSFSFLKALDEPQMSGQKNSADLNVGTSLDSIMGIKSRDSRLQGLNQPMKKETKPVIRSPSFNETKNTSLSAPYYGGKGITSHEAKGALPERQDGGFQNGKQEDSGFEGYQQKGKEAKPDGFSFLKALDEPQTSGQKNSADLNAGTSIDSFMGIKSKDSRLQGLNQPMKKETKPVSFDFLKPSSSGARSPFFNETKSTSLSAPYYGGKGITSHEVKGALPERQDRAPPNVNEVSSNINRSALPSTTVCIQYLPGHSNLGLVREALSLHGEVISSFKMSNSDGSCTAFIEFKTSEAMDGALASRWVQIDSKAYNIVRADLPITTVVRLSKVSAETTEIQLVTICEKFGSLDNIRRRGNGVYDLYYKERELSSMPTILGSLNEVTLNRRRWLALPAPLLHPAMRKEVLKGSEGQAWHASQLSHTLRKIEMGLDAVSVCFEDLKALMAMEDELTK